MTAPFGTAVILWIAVLIGSIVVIAGMTVTTDLTALLPRSADPTQELLVAQLRDGVAARLMLIALEGAVPEQLAGTSRRLAEKLRASGLFTYVNNGDAANLAAEREVLMRHRYVLSSAITADHFTERALRTSLERQLQLLGSPAGAVTKAVLPADPTGELGRYFPSCPWVTVPRCYTACGFPETGRAPNSSRKLGRLDLTSISRSRR